MREKSDNRLFYYMKYSRFFILLFILFFVIPLGINLLVGLPKELIPFHIVGDDISWLGFWASYLSAAATLIMVIFTWLTLKQNSQQLEELKRQWSEDHRARLSFSIVSKQGLFMLKIANVGRETAYNIRLTFSDEYIESLLADSTKEIYRKLNGKSFSIEPSTNKYFYLSPIYGDSSVTFHRTNEEFSAEEINRWLNMFRYIPIRINGSYCDNYHVSETLKLDDYLLMNLVVNDELTNNIEDIRKGTVINNDQFYPIQKSLDIIAKNMS